MTYHSWNGRQFRRFGEEGDSWLHEEVFYLLSFYIHNFSPIGREQLVLLANFQAQEFEGRCYKKIIAECKFYENLSDLNHFEILKSIHFLVT